MFHFLIFFKILFSKKEDNKKGPNKSIYQSAKLIYWTMILDPPSVSSKTGRSPQRVPHIGNASSK